MVARRKKSGLLAKKLRRDILENWKSFTAVFLICLLSVTLYMGIDSAWRGMEVNLNMQFEACSLGEIWVSGEISDRMTENIAALDMVEDAQRRVVLRSTARKLSGEPKLDVYMADGDFRINKPMITKGIFDPAQKNTCVLAQDFADARGIHPGDSITLEIGGEPIDILVTGLGYSAEYVVFSDSQNFKVDPFTFGYAYVSPGTMSHLPYTEVSVALAEGADPKVTKQAISALLDDDTMIILTRDDKMGIKMAVEEVIQVRALGSVFPVVFFLIAALITWSTMKRLVDNQRLQIGTLRSMGYTKGQLIRHYTSYGLIISIIGALLGLVLGRYVIGTIIMEMLRALYVMPGGDAFLNPVISVAISLLMVLIASGASYLSCRQALREMPASLLRPKPPKSGRRVFLERIPFLWKRLSFGNKLIIRNMLRNKTRLFIGIIGITGCVALLLTGFGMRDSVAYVLDNHYGNTMRYDMRLTFDTQVSEEYMYSLARRGNAETMETMMEQSCEVSIDNGVFEIEGLFVLEDEHNMVYFEGRDGSRAWLPKVGAAITEKMAEDTGLAPGDVITLRALNGREAKVPIVDVVSIQLGQGVYFSRSAWRSLDIMPYMPTTLLLGGQSIHKEALTNMEGINSVRTLLEEREANGMVVQILDLVVALMVLFAGALAFVVLFTLGQLNFFERLRELATLMVLGYYPRENKRLILRENMIIAFISIPIGLYAGPYLHRWVLKSGLPTILEFVPYIAPFSWWVTPLLTLFFAWFVNLIVGAKFKNVDMVEALKSVE